MFCTKCGNNNPDGVTFCTSCGAPIGAPKAPTSSGVMDKMPPQVKDFVDKMKNSGNDFYKKVGIAVAAVIALIIVISVIVSNTGINGTINKYEKAMKKFDGIAMNEVMYPKSYINDVIIEEQYDGDKGEYKEEMKEQQKEAKEEAKEEKAKILSVKKKGKIKDLKKSDIEDLGYEKKSEVLEAIEEEFDIDNVKDIKKCKLKVTYKEDGDKDDFTQEWYFYKAGGKWYMIQAFSLMNY